MPPDEGDHSVESPGSAIVVTTSPSYAAATPISQLQTPSLQAAMTSQDIYLCTTIDLMAANGTQQSLDYFIHHVECFTLTLIDAINWQLFKEHAALMADRCIILDAAIRALQAIHKGQANGIALTKAASMRPSTTIRRDVRNRAYTQLWPGTEPEAMTFDLLLDENGIASRRIIATFSRHPVSTIDSRIAAWLLIAHAAARRGGNTGLLSSTLRNCLEHHYYAHPLPPVLPTDPRVPLPTEVSILAALTAPIFDMCTRIQIIAGHTADLSHYHRSRITADDQEEVNMLLKQLETQLHDLWKQRTPLLRHDSVQIRESLAAPIAIPFLRQTRICKAMYHTEVVEVGRILSDPPFASDEARVHMRAIRDLVMEELEANNTNEEADKALPVGFLRPLFLHAIESLYEHESTWAIKEMRRIKDSICRSDFFARFAEGLCQAQRAKRRRVTTRWFCLEAFDVTPPYL
ncbi:uncharacterized protein AB675_3843 [Cyphellophora attinorum]|uniref:Uncharacterized protein n=1 Tax=Cyphellophora attinorum TaxID=1664694 RepID=A0A0N1NXB5_9EURO|nr:uncharacterized protein AB675_3843 [Phialophora attinorum]KPI34907.1 hypothetical protein AB675_3843 [Phialophora attinorum]